MLYNMCGNCWWWCANILWWLISVDGVTTRTKFCISHRKHATQTSAAWRMYTESQAIVLAITKYAHPPHMPRICTKYRVYSSATDSSSSARRSPTVSVATSSCRPTIRSRLRTRRRPPTITSSRASSWRRSNYICPVWCRRRPSTPTSRWCCRCAGLTSASSRCAFTLPAPGIM